jgi:hypothetical protein
MFLAKKKSWTFCGDPIINGLFDNSFVGAEGSL